MIDVLEPLDEVTSAQFLRTSTATLATALFKRGFRSQFIQGVGRLSNDRIKMVGPAFTLRYMPAREDLDVIEVFKNPGHPQRLAVETIPSGHVLVMDCHGDSTAASAGAILLTRLAIRGCAGVVTDGGLRDADEIADMKMPAFCAARSAPTNLTKHHAVDINVPIGCGTAPVFPGDIMVGDGDGVIVIPRAIARELAEEVAKEESIERFILEEIKSGKALLGIYPPNEATRARYRDSIATEKR